MAGDPPRIDDVLARLVQVVFPNLIGLSARSQATVSRSSLFEQL